MRKEYMLLLLLFQRRPKTQINSIDDKWTKLRQNEYGKKAKKKTFHKEGRLQHYLQNV